MADELPIPDDLVQLQRDLDAASAELAAYIQAKTADRPGRRPPASRARQREATARA